MIRAQPQAGRTPDGITPLVGYRCWTLSIGPGHRALRSLNGQIVRQVNLDEPLGQRADPWLVARCLTRDHAAPEESCACGFYALKSWASLGSFLPFAVPRAMLYTGGAEPRVAAFPVMGRVDLAGKIIEHDLGYRAERMRITELRACAGTEPAVRRFARRIGVPVGESIPDPSTMGGGATPAPLDRLTPKEIEVIRLLANGSSTRRIASDLLIPPVTAQRHVENILVKLHVRSRLEAIAAMLRHPPPPDPPA